MKKQTKVKLVSKVDSLTEKQKALMSAYAKKWIDIGLKTGDADWETFDKYMPIAYAKAGFTYPKNVVRVKSPLIGALAASIAEGILRQRRKGDAVDGAVDEAVIVQKITKSNMWAGTKSMVSKQ